MKAVNIAIKVMGQSSKRPHCAFLVRSRGLTDIGSTVISVWCGLFAIALPHSSQLCHCNHNLRSARICAASSLQHELGQYPHIWTAYWTQPSGTNPSSPGDEEAACGLPTSPSHSPPNFLMS